MDFAEIDARVRASVQELVEQETDVSEFSWSLVPAKGLLDNGLGLTSLNAWWLMLEKLRDDYFPQEKPFTSLPIEDNALAEETHSKPLNEAALIIVNRLTG